MSSSPIGRNDGVGIRLGGLPNAGAGSLPLSASSVDDVSLIIRPGVVDSEALGAESNSVETAELRAASHVASSAKVRAGGSRRR